MTSAVHCAFNTLLEVLGLTLVAATGAMASQRQPQGAHVVTHPEDLRGSFGKPETITGMLSGVDPETGVIIVTLRGPHEPPSVQLSWTETVSSDTKGHVDKSPVTVSQGPGETVYDFRVTRATLIQMNGADASLGGLAQFPNAKATVRFTPRRSGDFALEITVSR